MSAEKTITVKVNGVDYTRKVRANRTLLEFIREDLGLTGTKEGCGDGNCGACTVLLAGQPVNACLVLAAEVDGQEITTVEGLAKGDQLHPLQQAFVEAGAIQCGFCTSGMLLTAKSFLDSNPHPSRQEIRQALTGNLCRCTGYQKIIDAVEAVATGKKDKQD